MTKGRQEVLPQDAKQDIKKFLILIFFRPAGKKQIEDCKKQVIQSSLQMGSFIIMLLFFGAYRQ